MRKFIEKIHSRFNLKNKSFYRAVSALMAVAVVISVCSSLITPAISLTSPAATSLMTTASSTTSTDTSGNTYPYTLDQVTGLSAHNFEPQITNVSVDQTDEDGLTTTSVTFDMEFSLAAGILSTSTYVYYVLPSNIEIPDGGLPADGKLGTVTKSGLNVGTFRIEKQADGTGLIVIDFYETSDVYYQNTGTGSYESAEAAVVSGCHLSFDAEVGQSENNDEDEEDINFKYSDVSEDLLVNVTGLNSSKLTVEKTAATPTVDENGKRTIEWTVTVSNPETTGKAISLSGLTLNDSMFGEDGVELTGQSETYGTLIDGVYTFGATSIESGSSIEITYTTPVTAEQELKGYTVSENNEVTLEKGDDTFKKATATTKIEPSFSVTKEAATVSRTGTDRAEVTWKVVISNTKGVNLEDYYIEDSRLSRATDITVEGADYTYTDGGNTIKFSSTDNSADNVTITYTTTENSSTIDNWNGWKNTAELKNPDTNESISDYAEVVSSPISLTKSGQANQGKGTITWTVTLEDKDMTDNYTLNDAVITDSLIREIAGTDYSSVTVKINDADTDAYNYDSETGTYTITETSDIKKITLTYTTDADADYTTNASDGVYTTHNEVSATVGDEEYTAEKDVEYDFNYYTVSKSASSATLNDDGELEVTWTITIEGEEGFFSKNKGIEINDVLSAEDKTDSTVSLNNVIDSESRFFTYYSKTADSDYTQFTNSGSSGGNKPSSSSDKKVNYTKTTDSDGNTNLYVTTNLDDSVIGLKLVYTSTIDISGATTGDVIHYGNTVSVDNKTATAGGDYTKLGGETLVKCAADDDSTGEDTEINFDDLETVTVDGEECYLLRWKLVVNENGSYDTTLKNGGTITITDTLPDGFTLYTVANATKVWTDKPNLCYWPETWGAGVITEKDSTQWSACRYSYDSDSRTVTFTLNIYDTFKSSNGATTIVYAAYIAKDTVEATIDTGKNYTVKNTVKDSLNNSDKQTQTIISDVILDPDSNEKILTKTSTQDDSNGQQQNGTITYTIYVNPGSQDLALDSDTITLTDLLKFDTSTAVDEDGNAVTNAADLLNVSLESIKVEKVNSDGTTAENITDDISYIFRADPSTTTYAAYTLSEATSDEWSALQSWSLDSRQVIYKVENASAGDVINFKISTSSDISVKAQIYGEGANATITDSKAISNGDTLSYTVPSTYTGDYLVFFLEANTWGTDISNYVTGVTAEVSTTTDSGVDAELVMTVPDSTYLKITYMYKAASQEIASIKVSNSVSANVGGSTTKATNSVEYYARQNESAYVETNDVTIRKIDVAKSAVYLTAGFKLARYNTDESKWEYAAKFEDYNPDSTSTSSTGVKYVSEWTDTLASAAQVTTDADNANALKVALVTATTTDGKTTYTADTGAVYALIETATPAGYDSSAAQTIYFAYESYPSTYPSTDVNGDKLSSSSVKLYSSGDVLSVKNRKTISIPVEKVWSDTGTHEEVTVELRRTITPLVNGSLADDADYETVATATLNSSNSWKHTWTTDDNRNSLYNGDEYNQPYYYYVVETSVADGYTVTYSNNGVNSPDSTDSWEANKITVTNTKGLTIQKTWANTNGLTVDAEDSSVTVDLYKSTEAPPSIGSSMPSDDNLELVEGNITLSEANSWTYSYTDALEDGYYYYVKESSTGDYTAVYTGNGRSSGGTITVKNVVADKITLPKTGGSGTAPIVAAGAAITATSAGLLIYRRKKRKNK